LPTNLSTDNVSFEIANCQSVTDNTTAINGRRRVDTDTALPHPTVARSSTPAAFANCESYTRLTLQSKVPSHALVGFSRQ